MTDYFKHGQHVKHKTKDLNGIYFSGVYGGRIARAVEGHGWDFSYDLADWEPAMPAIGTRSAMVKPTEHGPEFLLEVTPRLSTGEYAFTVLVDGKSKCGNVVPMQPEEPKEDLAQAMVHYASDSPAYIVRDSNDDTWIDVRSGDVRYWQDWASAGTITLGWENNK